METKHYIFAAVLAGAGFLFWKNMNEASAAELDLEEDDLLGFEEDDLLGFEEDEFLPSGAAPELTLLPGGLDAAAAPGGLSPEFAPAGPAAAAVPGGLSPEFDPVAAAPMRGPSRRSGTTGIIGAPPVTSGSAGPTKAELALIARLERRRRLRGNLNPFTRSEKTSIIHRIRQRIAARRAGTTGVIGAPPVTSTSAEPTNAELALIVLMERRRRARGILNPFTRSEKTAIIRRLRQKRRQEVVAAVRGKVATKKAKVKAKAKVRRTARRGRRSARREAVAEFITR